MSTSGANFEPDSSRARVVVVYSIPQADFSDRLEAIECDARKRGVAIVSVERDTPAQAKPFSGQVCPLCNRGKLRRHNSRPSGGLFLMYYSLKCNSKTCGYKLEERFEMPYEESNGRRKIDVT